jgi:hypothetical protein
MQFEWLLADRLVAERLSAGLAGFPAQLDLLLSPAPFSGLLNESATVVLDHPESIEGRVCHVVRIRNGESDYRLWLDQATMLLRRIQLPNSSLPPPMLSDRSVSDPRLTVEFAQARINSPIVWNRFAVTLGPEDRPVSYFVPEPIPLDTRGLGERVPAFVLASPADTLVFNSADKNPKRKATVLIWLANHEVCRLAAEQIAGTAQELKHLGIPEGMVEFVPIWAEPKPPPGMTFEELATDWKLPGKLAIDRNAMGRDIFDVYEAPTTIVLDAENQVQVREARGNPLLDQILPDLLVRLIRGERLAEEVIVQQESAAERHIAELEMATSVSVWNTSYREKMEPTEAYPPSQFSMVELMRERLSSESLALSADAESLLWILHTNGELSQRQVLQTSHKNYRTAWPLASAPVHGHLEVATTGDFVAFNPHGSSNLHIFACETEQRRSLDLGSTVKVHDMHWTVLDKASPRLAAFLSDGRSLLLDPTNQEQLSGVCPSEPMAWLNIHGQETLLGGFVALSNRSLEPLLLPSPSLASVDPLSSAKLKTLDATSKTADESLPTRLDFRPSQGPWLSWQTPNTRLILARGWLAQDEPALFMLDSQCKKMWHYRMPLDSSRRWPVGSVTTDPQMGQAIWAVQSGDTTVHVLSSDGAISDHFRASQPIVGLSLVPLGDRLVLSILHPRELVHHQIRWR